MKACLGTLGELDCLYWKKKYVEVKNGRVKASFLGWADTKPSTPVTYNLHAYHEFRLIEARPDTASSEQPSEFIRSLTGLVTWLKGLVMSLV